MRPKNLNHGKGLAFRNDRLSATTDLGMARGAYERREIISEDVRRYLQRGGRVEQCPAPEFSPSRRVWD